MVIGGVAAGTSAAKARRIDPEADVKIFQEESVVSYGACGIPYVIEGLISNFEKLIERPPDAFKSKYDVDVLTNLIIVGAFDYSCTPGKQYWIAMLTIANLYVHNRNWVRLSH